MFIVSEQQYQDKEGIKIYFIGDSIVPKDSARQDTSDVQQSKHLGDKSDIVDSLPVYKSDSIKKNLLYLEDGTQPTPQFGAKHHRKVLHDNIQGVTEPAIRHLTHHGGVKRISGLIYEEIHGLLKVFLEDIICDSVTYTQHTRHKTITAMDVVYALKHQGRTLMALKVKQNRPNHLDK